MGMHKGDPIVNRNAERFIPVASTCFGHGEAEAAADTVLRNWISMGERVAEFERDIAEAHAGLYGVACCSGTTALHLALAALRIGPGDSVILPALTMIAVANAVLYTGATPVFIDSEPDTGNPDLQLAYAAMRGRTRAMIVPHLYGVPAKLEGFDITLPVIEDCAEAHYASYPSGKPVGSASHMACFSFFANKICAAGEGGMVTTRNPKLADRMRSLRSHAFTPGDHFRHSELAFGYRMTDLQAAVGIVQHKHRELLLARRQAIARQYLAELQDLDAIECPQDSPGRVWWVFNILVSPKAKFDRDALRGHLGALGIDTRSYFRPMHWQPFLTQYASGKYPVAEDLSRRGLYCPLWPGMTNEDVSYVSAAIRSFC